MVTIYLQELSSEREFRIHVKNQYPGRTVEEIKNFKESKSLSKRAGERIVPTRI